MATVALTALACSTVIACGARTELFLAEPSSDAAAPKSEPDAGARSCPDVVPRCVARNASDPCGAPHLVPAECDAALLAWRCPSGSFLYARSDTASECLPLHDQPEVSAVTGTLAAVPTEDGKCLWVAEDVLLSDGAQLRNVGFEVTPTFTFGTCPQVGFAGGIISSSVAFSDGTVDPTLLVQITGGYLLDGKTRVTYRLFRVDPSAVFGATVLGSGLGYWDSTRQQIIVFGAEKPRFEVDLSLGNASLVDENFAYVWGCNRPGAYLSEGCLLARLDPRDKLELYLGNDAWSASAATAASAVVFEDGPWISSVRRSRAKPDSLLHVFITNFDHTLQVQGAARAEGPWGGPTPNARCALPALDPKAFCAAPVVHEELADPTRPTEVVVSYDVDTTSTNPQRSIADYWSRLVWTHE